MNKYELFSIAINIHNNIVNICDKHKLSTREKLFIIKSVINMLIEDIFNSIDWSITDYKNN